MAFKKTTFNSGDVLPSSRINDIQDAIIGNESKNNTQDKDILELQEEFAKNEQKDSGQDAAIANMQKTISDIDSALNNVIAKYGLSGDAS